jgi:thiamine-monophosphate kinase
LQAAGGDDYELCFTASAAAREAVETAARTVDVAVTRVGRITARGPGPVAVFDRDGAPWLPGSAGWRHFAD